MVSLLATVRGWDAYWLLSGVGMVCLLVTVRGGYNESTNIMAAHVFRLWHHYCYLLKKKMPSG